MKARRAALFLVLATTSALMVWILSITVSTVGDVRSIFKSPQTSSDLDAATAFHATTGLILPSSAKITHFEYLSGMDDCMTLRFEIPRHAAEVMMKDKLFSSWKRFKKSPDFPPLLWSEKPSLPYQETEVSMPEGRYMNVVIEELKPSSTAWTVWVAWHET